MALLANPTSKKYSFESGSQNLQSGTFAVVSFKGYEALSRLYNFEIKLVTENTGIDLGDALNSSATFTIHRAGDDVVINGELAQFEETSKYGQYIFYRALLVPKLWLLTLARSNQVFLGHAIQEQAGTGFVETVLEDPQVGLTTNDYSFDLRQQPAPPTPPATAPKYPQVEYVCQYNESHFNFISRWLEREGIYYFFERTATEEKAVFVDDKSVHVDLVQGATLTYSPASGLGSDTEIIASFICRRQTIPRKVVLKDYNYETPAVDLKCEKDVDPVDPTSGTGEVYLYGENFTTDTEGDRLAGIRAEEFLCRRELYIGESNVPFMQPGYAFTLQGHYRAGYNSRYLIVDVTHEGSQTGYLVSGIASGLTAAEKDQPVYRNSFTAIPAAVQFRAERRAGKPRIVGTMNAEIDAVQSGDYAELDDKGRYKVKLPFDLVSTRTAGQNSCYVRMMQPYSGIKGGGFHFPLHKGAEVLLSFINGDPDRPVIAGAVPNPVTPSVVVDTSQQTGKILTDGGNYIEFGDTKDSEYIEIYSPCDDSSIRCGLQSTEPDDIGNGISVYTEGEWFNTVSAEASITVLGNTAELFVGAKESVVIAETLELFVGAAQSFFLGLAVDVSIGGTFEFVCPHKYHVTIPLKKDITKLRIKAVVDELETTLDKKIAAAKSKIDVTNKALENSLDKKVTTIDKKITLYNKRIDSIKTGITTAQNGIAVVKNNLETVKNDISDTKVIIADVQTSLGQFNTSIQEAKTSIGNQQTSLEKISTKVEKVDAKIQQATLFAVT